MDHKTPFLLFNPPLQHSVMNKINPLDQPEIRLLIAEHLRGVDLVRCLRVCRSWHDTFLPFVWEKVSVGKVNWTQPSPSQDSLTPEVLRSHRHFIKALHILDSPGSCSFTFPQMQTMNFRPYNGTTPSLAKYLVPLIGWSQSLVKLDLWSHDKDIDYRLWKALLKLPHLRELRLVMLHIQQDDIVRFWTICENLESLKLEHVTFPRGTIHHASMCFRNIRKLSLTYVRGMEEEEQFRFISACPNPEDFSWFSSHLVSYDPDDGLEDDIRGPYFEEFAKEVACKRWPRLTSMTIDAQWTEEDACLIIEGMQRVKYISLGDTFGPLTFQALQRHFNSLVELHVELGNEVASELLQNILCSCPALKMLIGGGVPAKDVVEGKPWVCLSLEYLTISFMFSDREEHLQPLIFERLAKLKRLECIDSGAAITLVQGKHPVPLQFRLESGLDALSSLWRMVSLTTGYGNSLGEEELRWMMVHWKDLISVSGEVDIDSDTKIELEDLFKFRGIKLRR